MNTTEILINISKHNYKYSNTTEFSNYEELY